MRVAANGLEFEVEIDEPAPATLRDGVEPASVLLIMGLGMQLIAWPEALVSALTGAGYRVIRFDNRDIGLSSHTPGKAPNLALMTIKYRLGVNIRTAYTLRHMVDDTAGVLDALGVTRCHVVGVSMGGMIAQGLASRYPDRVQSLVSIMSTTGARHLPKATSKASFAFIARPRSRERDVVVEHLAKVMRVIGSPKYPTPLPELRERIGAAYDRAYYPAGMIKQLAAIVASGDRTDEVRAIKAPTLVIHGRDDPLVPVQNGEETARRIPGSELVTIIGMGHDFGPLPQITQKVLAFLAKHAGKTASA